MVLPVDIPLYTQLNGGLFGQAMAMAIMDNFTYLDLQGAGAGSNDIYATGVDQTTALVSLFASLTSPTTLGLSFKTGRYEYSGLTSTPYIFDIQNIIGKAINGNGSTLVLNWDPANPDTTIPNSFRFLDCQDIQLLNFTFDMSPSPFCQGIVTAVNGTQVIFRPSDNNGTANAAFAPAFVTADYIIQLDPTRKNIEVNNQFDSTPGTLLPVGDETYAYTAASGVPAWAAPGQTITICVRKRAANTLFLRAVGLSTFNVTFRAASAVAVRCENLLDGNVFKLFAQGPGFLSCSGALCNAVDGRGTLNYTAIAYGLGDDMSNLAGSRVWNTLSTTANSATVAAFNTSTGTANGPMTPQVNDQVEVWNNLGLIAATMTVGSVIGLTVTFTTNLPGGIDLTTWYFLNRSCVQVLRIPYHQCTGPSGGALIAQSHDWQVDTMINNGVRNVGSQGRNPSSEAHIGIAGFKGGGWIGLLISDYSNTAYATYATSILDAYLFDSNFAPLTVASGFPPVTIGLLLASNYGYNALACAGVDINVAAGFLRAGGGSRGMLDSTKPGANDLWTPLTGATIRTGLANLNTSPATYGTIVVI